MFFCFIRQLTGCLRQTYYAYDIATPLWIISKEKDELLKDADEYIDLWSSSENIPKYHVDEFNESRTSIIVPIRKKGHGNVIGVINFESTSQLSITDEAKAELEVIADAASQLFKSSQFNTSLVDNTKSAISSITSSLNTTDIPKLTKPRIFVASSQNANGDVIEVILEEIKKRSEIVDLVYWKDIKDAGNIARQIYKAITTCRYGVCYLSEENLEQNTAYGYTDNPNVVFEAGMFHGRGMFMASQANCWIPIRESDSPDAPSDFKFERMIFPNRSPGDQALAIDEFRLEFIERLDAMLDS